jgi:hypothetical protein
MNEQTTQFLSGQKRKYTKSKQHIKNAQHLIQLGSAN